MFARPAAVSAPAAPSAGSAWPLSTRSISRAARLPMPIASVTKRAMLAASPPAHTPCCEAAWRASTTSKPPSTVSEAANAASSGSWPIDVTIASASSVNSPFLIGSTVNCPRTGPGSKNTHWQLRTSPSPLVGVTALSIAPSASAMPSSSASSTSARCAGILAAGSSERIVTWCPARRALRAASSAALPPPITTRRFPRTGGAPALVRARYSAPSISHGACAGNCGSRLGRAAPTAR